MRAAAAELGYRPNVAARALKMGAARTIVLVVPDITNPFFGGLLRGAQTAARAAGYAVALIDTNNDRDWGAASAEALHAGPADGLLLFEVDPPRRAAGSETIVVIEGEAAGTSSVRLDVETGTEAAVRHLIELGHTPDRPRRVGARAADVPRLRRAWTGSLAGEAPRIRSEFTLDAARDAARELLGANPELTAVFCDDDVIAAGAYLAARELRRAHPRRPVGRRVRRARHRARARSAARRSWPTLPALGASRSSCSPRCSPGAGRAAA